MHHLKLYISGLIAATGGIVLVMFVGDSPSLQGVTMSYIGALAIWTLAVAAIWGAGYLIASSLHSDPTIVIVAMLAPGLIVLKMSGVSLDGAGSIVLMYYVPALFAATAAKIISSDT